MVMLDKSMPVFFSRPVLFQTFSPTLNQMHVVVFSKSAFRVANPLTFHLVLISCTLSVGPRLVPRTLNIKKIKVKYGMSKLVSDAMHAMNSRFCTFPSSAGKFLPARYYPSLVTPERFGLL